MTVKALVVGGAGFIGSHLVDRLLAGGDTVDVVDDLSIGSLANLADARSAGGTLKIHHLDVGTPEAASLLGMRAPDVVFHLAALPRRPAGAMALGRAFTTTIALLDAIRVHAIPKVVVALPATTLYGSPATRDLPLKEQPLEPRGLRGVIARATVDLLATHREADAIEFTVLALATVYGPRQRPDGGVVAAFVDAAAAGRSPTITGDGRQTRDLVFVDDAVDALVRAGTRGSGLVVNVGTGEQTSIRELWNLVSGGHGAEPVKAPARPDELPRFALSPVRARIHLGWSPWTSVADGLRQTR
jgi:UDP-glucose 4-epimerase